MFDLTNHFPYGPAAGIQECGLIIKAFQPGNNRAQCVVVVQAFKAGVMVAEREVPLTYPNLFGIDVVDADAIEQATEKILGEFGVLN